MSDEDIQVSVVQPAPLNVRMIPSGPVTAKIQTPTPLTLKRSETPVSVHLQAPAALDFKLGIAGAGFYSPISFEREATLNGAQTLALPHVAMSGWNLLCINGLRQSVTEYSVSGNLLSLPSGLNVLIGDLISFDFYPTH